MILDEGPHGVAGEFQFFWPISTNEFSQKKFSQFGL